jgi:hypothetical protein
MSDQPRDCEHGQLARQCRICELEAEVARLKAPPDQERLRAIAEREQNSGAGPWSHDGRGIFIFGRDEGQMIAEVRGWGYLTGAGGLGLDDDEAVDRQKAIGEFIALAKQDVPYLLSLVARQTQEIQDLRTERDKLEYVNVKQDMQIVAMEQSDADNFKRFMVALSSRDALREALKKIHEYAIGHISPGWESVEEITTAALAETPTEDQR